MSHVSRKVPFDSLVLNQMARAALGREVCDAGTRRRPYLGFLHTRVERPHLGGAQRIHKVVLLPARHHGGHLRDARGLWRSEDKRSGFTVSLGGGTEDRKSPALVSKATRFLK